MHRTSVTRHYIANKSSVMTERSEEEKAVVYASGRSEEVKAACAM